MKYLFYLCFGLSAFKSDVNLVWFKSYNKSVTELPPDSNYIDSKVYKSLAEVSTYRIKNVSNERTKIRQAYDTVYVDNFHARGNGTSDDTQAIQNAINSGAKVLIYSKKKYNIKGELKLKSNQKHYGNGATLLRITNNSSQSLFFGSGISNLVLDGFIFLGKTTKSDSNYNSNAACVRIINSKKITIKNSTAKYGVSGFHLRYVDNVNLTNLICSNNILTGISAIVNNVELSNITSFNNGYPSKGQTHEIYIINSSNGVLKNSKIGKHNDPTSEAVVLRFDLSDSKKGFNSLENWNIYNNSINNNGISIGSDPGVPVKDRKPPINVSISNNNFNNSAGLKFDDPEKCLSKNNKGITNLICRVASNYGGYSPGLISTNDECSKIIQSSLKNLTNKTKNSIVFDSPVIWNGDRDGLENAKGFGGVPSMTLITPNFKGKKNVQLKFNSVLRK